MAIVYPLANGNWSSVLNWYTSGATYNQLPQAGDDVYADGKTIVIDVDFTINTLNTTQRVGGTASGFFTCSTTRTITFTTFTNGCTGFGGNAFTFNGTSGTVLTIIGNNTSNSAGNVININNSSTGTINISGDSNAGTGVGGGGGGHAVYNNSSGIINITGNVRSNGGTNCHGVVNLINGTINMVGNAISSGNNALLNNGNGICNLTGNSSPLGSIPINNASTGTINITGNQTVNGNTGIYAISNSSTGIININGDCLGALSGAPSNAYIVTNSSNGIVNINGSVIQRSVGPSASVGIVNNGSTGTINISGNIGGGSVQSSIGVSNASTGTINVNGSVSGGTNAIMTPAIYSTTAGIINVTGNTISNLYPAIYSTNASATHRLYGNLVSNNGIFPIYGLTTPLTVRISPSNSQTIVLQDSSNVSRSFDTSNVTTGLPAASNVRKNITYGITNQYAGTMYVPTPDNVRKDVLTDNTVGTADLSVSSLIDTLTGSTNPMAVRLRNVSTAQITGSQITGLLNNP